MATFIMIMNSFLSLLFFIIALQLSSTSAATINTWSSSDSACSIFPPPATDTTSVICVDKSGCCNFTNVQAAVDAVDNLSQKRTIIWINSGTYIEKVKVTKSNVTFQGQGFQSTFIAWNDTADSAKGTVYSASVYVSASNFIAKNISFRNLTPRPNRGNTGVQAVALRMEGDQAAFWGCGFYGYQDTLLDDKGRHYFKDCFIEGAIDFIFGDARSLYENCQLNSIAQPNGAITAHGRDSSKEDTGFAFVNCSITGTGSIWLGRAWRPYSRVVFAFTSIADIISPDGWNDMGNSSYQQTVFFGEYMCTGPGANMSKRVPYARSLTFTEASQFLNASFIDGDQWLQPY